MLITNHVVAGALVGAASPGPVTGFAVGLVSHFALDRCPHWGDPDHEVFLRVAVVDGLVGLGVMGAVTALAPRAARARVVAGMLGSCLPDADKPSVELLGRSPFPAAVDAWHKAIQRESPRRMPQEVVVALAGSAVLVAVRAAVRRQESAPSPC